MSSQVIASEAAVAPLAAARAFAAGTGLAPVVLRLALAVTMFPHGAQKALGWFGGYGWSGTMAFLTEGVGLPGVLAAGVILLELVGPLLLVAGLLTRAVAAGFAALMTGAIVTTHWQHGFFMNWFGNQEGEGFEFHLLAIGIAVALVVGGAGRWSVDARLAGRAAR